MATKNTIALSQVKHTFDVRRQLNTDYVMQLALHVEAGKELPPVTLTPTNEIIDGRHRLKAYELAGRSEIPYTVARNLRDDKCALLTAAFNANIGGALPPTSEDIIFSIMQFIDAKVSRTQVLNSLNLPKEVTFKYYTTAANRLRARKLQQARSLVADGVSIPKAAEQLGLDDTEVRTAIRQESNKNKTHNPTTNVANTKTSMGRSYQAHSMKIATVFKRLATHVETGNMSSDDVHILFNHAWKLADQHVRNIAEWRDRFDNGTAAIAKAGR